MMKKILMALMLCLVSIMSFGQYQDVFTEKIIFDKWNDVIFNKDVKTIMTVTDSKFVFETKGKKPITYVILEHLADYGSEDKPVELVPNLYGYQVDYSVVELNDVRENGDKAHKMRISIRTVTDKYGFEKMAFVVIITKSPHNNQQERTVFYRNIFRH